MRRYRLPNPWLAGAWLAALAYAGLLAAATIAKHDHFRSGGYDLGIFEQALWLLAHGHAPFSTIRGRDLFADHFQPGLALLTPLGRLPLPSSLLVFQAAALAAAGPLLYALACLRGASRPLAFAVGLLWLASPLTQWANLFDFHPETVVPGLLVLAAILLERERTGWFLATVLVATSFKEDVSLVFLAWGLVLAWQGRRRLGIGLAAAALAWFTIALEVAIPTLGGDLTFYSQRFAGNRGSTVGSVLFGLIEHPLAGTEHAATKANADIVVALVACTGGLCLLAPRMLALAFPAVLANVLSDYSYQHDLHFQYQLVPAAACALASAYGAGVVSTRLHPPFKAAAAGMLVAGAAAVTFVHSPAVKELRMRPPPAAAAKRRAFSLIPRSASVAAAPDLTSHLAERRDVYELPEPFYYRSGNGEYWSPGEVRGRAVRLQYVLYDTAHLDPVPAKQRAVLSRRLPRIGYRIVYAEDGVVLLKRGG